MKKDRSGNGLGLVLLGTAGLLLLAALIGIVYLFVR